MLTLCCCAWLCLERMDVLEEFDFLAAISRLLEDPGLLSTHELATLSSMISVATNVPAVDLEGVSVVATAVLALMDAGEGSSVHDVEAKYANIVVMLELQRRVDEAHVGPGRGYSEWPRAPDRVFTPIDRVSQYRVHPLRFREQFGLSPDEFDVLFGRISNELSELPDRTLDLPNRLAQALRYMRTKHNQTDVGAWFGCCKTCSNDDIDDVVSVIFNDATTAAEISWPTQAAR